MNVLFCKNAAAKLRFFFRYPYFCGQNFFIMTSLRNFFRRRGPVIGFALIDIGTLWLVIDGFTGGKNHNALLVTPLLLMVVGTVIYVASKRAQSKY